MLLSRVFRGRNINALDERSAGSEYASSPTKQAPPSPHPSSLFQSSLLDPSYQTDSPAPQLDPDDLPHGFPINEIIKVIQMALVSKERGICFALDAEPRSTHNEAETDEESSGRFADEEDARARYEAAAKDFAIVLEKISTIVFGLKTSLTSIRPDRPAFHIGGRYAAADGHSTRLPVRLDVNSSYRTVNLDPLNSSDPSGVEGAVSAFINSIFFPRPEEGTVPPSPSISHDTVPPTPRLNPRFPSAQNRQRRQSSNSMASPSPIDDHSDPRGARPSSIRSYRPGSSEEIILDFSAEDVIARPSSAPIDASQQRRVPSSHPPQSSSPALPGAEPVSPRADRKFRTTSAGSRLLLGMDSSTPAPPSPAPYGSPWAYAASYRSSTEEIFGGSTGNISMRANERVRRRTLDTPVLAVKEDPPNVVVIGNLEMEGVNSDRARAWYDSVLTEMVVKRGVTDPSSVGGKPTVHVFPKQFLMVGVMDFGALKSRERYRKFPKWLMEQIFLCHVIRHEPEPQHIEPSLQQHIPPISPAEIERLQKRVKDNDFVTMHPDMVRYHRDLILGIRMHPATLGGGISLRASRSLMTAARILAILWGKDYVTPDYVNAIAFSALVHRISVEMEEEEDDDIDTWWVSGLDVVGEVLASLVPPI
ncbi:hypothetical protein BJ742DRAFT_163794 [Cladochytrium replicatum]|nr:hypothetical protein BJ742DRAFT_163794 [Cladochytrium replicatum]